MHARAFMNGRRERRFAGGLINRHRYRAAALRRKRDVTDTRLFLRLLLTYALCLAPGAFFFECFFLFRSSKTNDCFFFIIISLHFSKVFQQCKKISVSVLTDWYSEKKKNCVHFRTGKFHPLQIFTAQKVKTKIPSLPLINFLHSHPVQRCPKPTVYVDLRLYFDNIGLQDTRLAPVRYRISYSTWIQQNSSLSSRRLVSL